MGVHLFYAISEKISGDSSDQLRGYSLSKEGLPKEMLVIARVDLLMGRQSF